MYAPLVTSARRLREVVLGPNHSGVLMDQIVSDTERGPEIEYQFLFIVFDRRLKDPIAFISSEKASASNTEAEGSHYLCAFLPHRRRNFGARDGWAEIVEFYDAALHLVGELALTAEPKGESHS
jgi:hypothetical protein